MHDLEDTDFWKTVSHAYGTADDIPKMLQYIKRNPSNYDSPNCPWDLLWSSLCHQSTIYSASLAAVPHIISAGVDAVGNQKLIVNGFISLPIEIEKLRPKFPQLKAADDYYRYFADLNILIDFAEDCHSVTLPKSYLEDCARLLRQLNLRVVEQESDLGPLFG